MPTLQEMNRHISRASFLAVAFFSSLLEMPLRVGLARETFENSRSSLGQFRILRRGDGLRPREACFSSPYRPDRCSRRPHAAGRR
jgi:hypothetical protein